VAAPLPPSGEVLLLIQQLESITQNIQAGVPEKHYADNSKKMKILYDKLTNGQIEPEVVGILHKVRRPQWRVASCHRRVQVQESIMAGNATQALKDYAVMTGTFW
jgi:hypothetical protein